MYDAYAVPAKPGPIEVVQPDGTKLTIRVYGDEFAHYTTTDDGYGVFQAADGFYYYLNTSVKAKDAPARTSADIAAMRNAPNGVPWNELSARRDRRTAEMGIESYNEAIQRAFDGRQKAPDQNLKGIVILAEYQDVHFTIANPNTSFSNLLNQDGYSVNGATDSAKNYYKDNSDGLFDPSFDVYGPYRVSQNAVYYGGNNAYGDDLRPDIMVQEALQLAYADGVDFSQYVDPGTGRVRDVFVFYAGRGEADGGGANTIWPHRWPNKLYNFTVGGHRFTGYACAPELGPGNIIAGIGTFCHEFGHVITWPDFYDTDYTTNGSALTPEYYDVMASGSYNNSSRTPPTFTAVERFLLGWGAPVELTVPGNYELPHVSNNEYYIIRADDNTGDRGEYYLFETRSTSTHKWDSGMSGTRNGLFVMQIDRTNTYMDRWGNNRVNAYSAHPCARPVRASTSNEASWVFPGGGNVTTLSETSHSYFKPWNNTSHGRSLSNIAYSGGKVTFTLANSNYVPEDPIEFTVNVVNIDNMPIGGANVSLVYQTEADGSASTKKLSATNFTFSGTTTGSGAFKFDGNNTGYEDFTREGSFIASTTVGGVTHTSAIDIANGGSVTLKIGDAVSSTYDRKAWHGNYSTPFKYANDGQMIIGSRFAHSDFSTKNRIEIKGADYHLSSAANVELLIYNGYGTGDPAYTIPVSNVISGNTSYVDLTSYNIVLDPGAEIVLAYKLTGYDTYPASSDATSSAKGGLVKSTANGSWSTAGANWLIGLYYEEMKPTGITFDNATMNAFVGDMPTVSYNLIPEGSYTNLEWTSSDVNILTINKSTGVIKALRPGIATVTASSADFTGTATCEITVTPEIDGGLAVVVDNNEKTAKVSWTALADRTNWTVRWRALGSTGAYSRQDVGRATSYTITGLEWDTSYEVMVLNKRGDDLIWGETATTFRCEKATATGVTLTDETLDLVMGDMRQVGYQFIPEDGVAQLLWSSSDESVFRVGTDGTVKAIGPGTATLTAYSDDFEGTATCEITITPEIEGLVIDVNNFERTAAATWTPLVEREKWTVRWKINGGDFIASEVTEPGIVFTEIPLGARYEIFISGARADGQIWAETVGAFEGSDKPAAESVILSDTEIELFENQTHELTATTEPAEVFNSEIVWSSSDESVAIVDQNGLVTAVGAGTAVITATLVEGGISADCQVMVVREIAPITSVTVYQNDGEFHWNGSSHQGSYIVELFRGSTLVKSIATEGTYAYAALLAPATEYRLVVSTVREDGGSNSESFTFTTPALAEKFAYMNIKGTYTATEQVPLRVVDIQSAATSVSWKIGSATVNVEALSENAPVAELAAGRHEITATVVSTAGTEVITKIVNVQ